MNTPNPIEQRFLREFHGLLDKYGAEFDFGCDMVGDPWASVGFPLPGGEWHEFSLTPYPPHTP